MGPIYRVRAPGLKAACFIQRLHYATLLSLPSVKAMLCIRCCAWLGSPPFFQSPFFVVVFRFNFSANLPLVIFVNSV